MSFDFSAVDALLGGYRQPSKRRKRMLPEADEPDEAEAERAAPVRAERPRESADPVTGGSGHGVAGLEMAIGAVFSVANPVPSEEPLDASPQAPPDQSRAGPDSSTHEPSFDIGCGESQSELSGMRLEDLVDALALESDEREQEAETFSPLADPGLRKEAKGREADAPPVSPDPADDPPGKPAAKIVSWTDTVRRV